LCGDVIAGDTTLKGRSLAGTVIQDFDNQDGFVNYCFLHDLEVVAFTYTPNSVGAATYTGNVTVQVPDETVGGDVNTRLTSDIDWQMGGLDIAYPSAATGATAGTPGTWTPSGSSPPADVAALQAGGVTASPSAAWTTGEYVQTGASGSAGEAHWDGTAWTAGKAP
jgi:hypothetical protein